MNISVVIPIYNRCKLLSRALLSVFSQTLLPAEVAVIDDGSTDGTNTMVRKEFPEVTYYRQENRGVSSHEILVYTTQQATGLRFRTPMMNGYLKS
jgi:glycosyltransferase involved in cell wall biosynthesis